jgi:DNA-binding MarR family transcriptional regulator
MSCKFKQILEEITGEKAPGPSPKFSPFHVLSAMELMAEKPIGRNKLAYSLKVGEGAVRTIINRMRKAGLIATSRAGCTLTSKGLNIWKECKTILKKKLEVGKSELTLADYNFAILVKNRGHKIKSGIEQRDAAVMVGAKSAVTIAFKEGRLIIPSVSDNAVKEFPKAAEHIIKLLEPEENDVIIIGGASSREKAEFGALAAAWTLLNDC